MRIDVFSCSSHTYDDAVKRANFHYQGMKGAAHGHVGIQYVGPVVNNKLHLLTETAKHIVLAASDPSSYQEGDGQIPTSNVYGLLVLERKEQVPWNK